jgi:hypothetical protein
MTWHIDCPVSCERDSIAKNPFCKGEKRRCLAGEERILPFEGKKIPAHMTRANSQYWREIFALLFSAKPSKSSTWFPFIS